MLQQEIVTRALQTYLLLSELFFQCLPYCVPDLGSNNHVTNHNENARQTRKTLAKKHVTSVAYYLFWRTFAYSMHFTLLINISQCCALIGRIERKKMYFLYTSTCLW